MGYVREKYTREYFLCETGKPGVGADGMEYFRAGVPHPRIVAELERVELLGMRVLDIGFGRGEALKYCLEQGASFVHGIDFSPAALHIARTYLTDWILKTPHKVQLDCADVLQYLTTAEPTKPYDVITMFDVLEHIPRAEAVLILERLGEMMHEAGALIITTPFYKADNDLLTQGPNPNAKDSSDNYPETQGMHCNRYTRDSLRASLTALGFVPVGDLLTLWRRP